MLAWRQRPAPSRRREEQGTAKGEQFRGRSHGFDEHCCLAVEHPYFSGAISNGSSMTVNWPRASHGNSSFARGLDAQARFLITVEATELSAFGACVGRASSGNCSNVLGLDAKARFFVASVKAVLESEDFARVTVVAVLRVSQGNASLALGLAATARLFNASAGLNTCPELVETFRDKAAALTTSRYNLVFVFMFFAFVLRQRGDALPGFTCSPVLNLAVGTARA